MRGQADAERNEDTTLINAQLVGIPPQSGTTLTETRSTTNRKISPSFVGDATCSTTDGSNPSQSWGESISQKLFDSAGIKPYYKTDSILIFNNDCRDILPLLEPGSVDLVLTDPPYLVDYNGRWGSEYESIANDDNDEWLIPAFRGIYRALKLTGICVSFYGWPQVDVFMAAWRLCGFRPVSHMVWVKNVWGLGYYTRGQHEQGFVLAMPETKKPDKAISDVIHFQRVQNPVHQNEKPVGALVPVIESFSPSGGIVLDPFMGSGSVAMASRILGRRYIGIELSETHCASAACRLQQSVMRFEEAV